MPHDEYVLWTYRNGGPEERMDIFLANPGLSGRFEEIEREEAAGPSFVNPPPVGWICNCVPI